MERTGAGRWLKGALFTLTLWGLAAPAGALDMMVWDQGLDTKLAYGESQGAVMRGQIVRGASGSVVILFSRSDIERTRSLYPDLRPRYEGELRGRQVWIRTASGMQPLEQFLAAYKLRLELAETSGAR